MDSQLRLAGSPMGWAACALVLVALVCFAWVGWVLADTAMVDAWQEREMAALEAAADTVPVATASEAPEWGALVEGDLVGRIEIERLDVSAPTLQGVTARTLRRAVGLIPGTARPGEVGNVGLAGHRDSFFRGLSDARVGDRIKVTTPHGVFEYQVDSMKVVTPHDTWVLASPAGGSEILTLVTCHPFYYVGPAPERFIVHAGRVDASR